MFGQLISGGIVIAEIIKQDRSHTNADSAGIAQKVINETPICRYVIIIFSVYHNKHFYSAFNRL